MSAGDIFATDADKRIAFLVVEVEMKNKEIRKWKDAWYQADDEVFRYQEELKVIREAAQRAKVLLDDATYHDGRYDQHTSIEWQKEACEVSALLEERE